MRVQISGTGAVPHARVHSIRHYWGDSEPTELQLEKLIEGLWPKGSGQGLGLHQIHHDTVLGSKTHARYGDPSHECPQQRERLHLPWD